MKKYKNEIVIGSLLMLFFAGSVFWLARLEPGSYLIISIAAITIFLGIASFTWQLLQKKRDLESGAPTEDEFTEKAKLYAGSQAFLYSLYLWLLIFVFNASFSKNQEMLGFGILGSALIYGMLLWYYKNTSEF